MPLHFLILLPLAIWLSASPAGAASPLLIDRLNEVRESIVTIKAQIHQDSERVGAGVILDSTGIIVTSTHTIANAESIEIYFLDGRHSDVQTAAMGRGRDFSFVRITPPSGLRPIEWADSDGISLGQEILNVGHSHFLRHTLSAGHVVGLGRNPDPTAQPSIQLFETDIVLYKGDSGGPVLDSEGRFLGLISAKHIKNRRSTSYAIPANVIRLAYLHYRGNK